MADVQPAGPSTVALADAVKRLEADYVAQNPTSLRYFKSAAAVLPGGNTRVALHFDPFPLFIDRAQSASVFDVDGHEYRDFMNDLTAGFYGHSDPRIISALQAALSSGLSFGGPHVHEAALASAICERFGSIDRVRFCNSGTEANLIAMGLARTITGRPLILAFHGAYHGSVASYLDAIAPLNVDRSDVRFARYNDINDVRRCLDAEPSKIAAIIIEPMIGSGGGILAEKSFLVELRELCLETGALLIFDEVQTSRFDPGGLQAVLGVEADITTLGKSVGGGLSFGAFGGRAEIIDRLDPSRPGVIPHGGTFNNNVLTMIAGTVGLNEIATREALHAANQRGDRLRVVLAEKAYRANMPLSLGGFGSIVSLHFQREAPRRPGDVKTGAAQRKLFHLYMLLQGMYIPRRGTINLSLKTTDQDCDAFANAFGRFAQQHGALC